MKSIEMHWKWEKGDLAPDSDPFRDLAEAERAARIGKGATYGADKKPLGQFRAVTLDLDGNGTITIAAKDEETNTVGFDWDDSGFNKQVAWVKPNDGFLFLDRDSNGVVTSGKELFTNSLVSDDYKAQSTVTTESIARCAIDTPAKCSNDAQNIEKSDESTVNDAYYEFNSGLRRFYAGEKAERLAKGATNDEDWRVAA